MNMLRLFFALTLVAAVVTACAPASDPAPAESETGDTVAPVTEPAIEEAVPPASAEPMDAPAEEAPMEEPEGEEAPAEEPMADAGDEDAMKLVITSWKDGMVALDIEKATAGFSDTYTDANASTKEEAVLWFQGVVDQGFLENLEIDDAEAKFEITGEEAIAGPYNLSSDAGQFVVDLHFKKEDGGWKITSTEVVY